MCPDPSAKGKCNVVDGSTVYTSPRQNLRTSPASEIEGLSAPFAAAGDRIGTFFFVQSMAAKPDPQDPTRPGHREAGPRRSRDHTTLPSPASEAIIRGARVVRELRIARTCSPSHPQVRNRWNGVRPPRQGRARPRPGKPKTRRQAICSPCCPPQSSPQTQELHDGEVARTAPTTPARESRS